MDNQRQKWVNLSFTAIAIMVAAILFVALTKVAAVYNLESSVKSIDLIIRLGSIALGAGLGLGLYLNDQSNAFANEVVLEMTRVTWPNNKESINATIWVILFVLISGAVLGIFDSLWAWIIKIIL
jgi:preprotein translocase SecE subunit